MKYLFFSKNYQKMISIALILDEKWGINWEPSNGMHETALPILGSKWPIVSLEIRTIVPAVAIIPQAIAAA